MATGKRKAVHLHYKSDDSAPSQHPAKGKKVERRRTGTGMNRSRLPKHQRITVKKVSDPEGRYPWAICLDGNPTWYRKSKEMALKHAAEIRADMKAGKVS
jgi:hypothetical protein